MAILIACLDRLFDEYNEIAPQRDKSSDGWIGDTSHQSGSSDHNPDESGNVPIHDADSIDEVHAIDVDEDLKEDGNPSMMDTKDHILERCRDGKEKRLRYIIYERKIYSASNGWREEGYSGSNPHDKHIHYSASYETKYESDTSSWTLEELVSLSDADKDWIIGQLEKYVGDSVQRWNTTGGKVDPSDPNQFMMLNSAVYYVGRDVAYLRTHLVDNQTSADPAAYND